MEMYNLLIYCIISEIPLCAELRFNFISEYLQPEFLVWL